MSTEAKELLEKEIKEWANGLISTIKKYTFTKLNPDKPHEVEDISIDLVGMDNEGNVAISSEGSVLTVNAGWEDSLGFVGIFTSQETAIAASKRFFYSEKSNELDQLKSKRKELDKQIEDLERELS